MTQYLEAEAFERWAAHSYTSSACINSDSTIALFYQHFNRSFQNINIPILQGERPNCKRTNITENFKHRASLFSPSKTSRLAARRSYHRHEASNHSLPDLDPHHNHWSIITYALFRPRI